jgi:hypothetical protein
METTPTGPSGDSVVVTPQIQDTVGVVGLTIVAAFLAVALVKLAKVNRDLCQRLLDSAETEPQ